MTQSDPKLVETSTPLAQSKLWSLQQKYFEHKSLSVWDKDVPSYISTNAFIAQLYAEQCLALFKDWCAAKGVEKAKFTLLEIAGGTGRFAFYFLKAINKLLKEQALDNIEVHYVLTDLSKETVAFYEKNTALKPYVEAGQCDFAVLDIENDLDVTLVHQKQTLSTILSDTPLMVIANYAFDFITQELFEFQDDRVETLWVEIKSRFPDFDVEKVDYVNELKLSFEPKKVDLNDYYDNPTLNQLLTKYRELTQDTAKMVNIPLGMLRFIDKLKALTQGHYMMLCGDKGITSIDEMTQPTENHCYYTFDGINTFRVNFHAVAAYLENQSGRALLSTEGENFKVNLFFEGLAGISLPHTEWTFYNRLMNFGPDDFCCTFDDYFANAYRFTFITLVGFLRLSQWDPIAYIAIHDPLVEMFSLLSDTQKQALKGNLKQVEHNLYPVTSHEKIILLLSILYEKLDEIDDAISLCERGLESFKENANLNLQLGMLYEKQKNSAKAIDAYQSVIKLKPKNGFAKKRLAALTGKVTLQSFIPVVKALFVFLCLGASFYLLTK